MAQTRHMADSTAAPDRQPMADRVEAGRFRLRSPREVPGTGGKIYEMALAVPGVHTYPWGEVLTPPEVLADPEWLASLEGVPVIDDDRVAHVEGVTPEDIGELSIGRILRARWDADQQVVIAEAVVDVARGLAKIAAGQTGVSAGYHADVVPEAGTWQGKPYTHRVMRRLPAHNVAVTYNPRHVVTHMQADARSADGGPMRLAELIAAWKAASEEERTKAMADAEGGGAMMDLIKMLIGAENRATMAEAKLAAVPAPGENKAPEEKAGDEKPAEEEKAADMEPEVGAYADALGAAGRLGVTIDRSWKLADLQRAVAKSAKAPMADSMSGDALTGFVAGLALADGARTLVVPAAGKAAALPTHAF